MILENKLSYTISLLSIENDEKKKEQYEEEYRNILKEIKVAKQEY